MLPRAIRTSGRLPDGTDYHGKVGVLLVDADGERVQCHLCGRWLKQLTAGHLGTHGWDRATYREAFGLKRSNPLQAPALSYRRAEVMRRQIRDDPRIREARLSVGTSSGGRSRRASVEERMTRRARSAASARLRSRRARDGREARARALGYESLDALLSERYVEQQASLAAIAAELRSATTTVRRDLERAGIPLRPPKEARLVGPRRRASRSRAKRERRARQLGYAGVVELLEARRAQGASMASVAEELGVHRRTLMRLLAGSADRPVS